MSNMFKGDERMNSHKQKVKKEMLSILDEIKERITNGDFNSIKGFNQAITKDLSRNRIKVSVALYRVRDTWTEGFMNRTKDGFYTFIIDYDGLKEEWLFGEIERLQQVYDLGDIDLFRSSDKGFHVRSSVKLTAREFVEIMNNSSCDSAFKNLPRFSTLRNWVLRDDSKGRTDKPMFIRTIPSKIKTSREQSSAHHKYNQLLNPDSTERIINPDGIMDMQTIKYATGGNV